MQGAGVVGAEARIGKQAGPDSPTNSGEAASRYEPLDVPPLLPMWLGALLAAAVGGVLLFIFLFFPLADHQEYRGPMKQLPPAPQLQSAPARDLQKYEAAKQRELNGAPGSVPIAVAMQQTAQQGWGAPR